MRKKGKKTSNSLDMMEDKDRDMLIETHNTKMTFKKEKHEDMKIIEEEKIHIQREILNMEKDTTRLKHEQMQVQNVLERNKIALLRLEMFKERQLIKKTTQLLWMII